MFKKNNKFTLIELIVVIAVLGILSSIVVPNINNMRSKAEITATVSNIRNIQTSVDMYILEHNGKYPTLEQPVLGKPSVIDFSLLETDYLRDKPEYANFNWWIDYTGTVYGSKVSPLEYLEIEEKQISWSKQEGNFTYRIYKKQEVSRVVASTLVSESELILLGETKENVFSDSRIKKDSFYVFEIIDQNGFASPKLDQEYKLPVSNGGSQDRVNNKPIAVISMTPENNLNNETVISWSYENSSDPDGDKIIGVEWKLNGVVQEEMPTVLEVGKHTIELTVQDEHGLWSEVTKKIVSVEKKNNKPIAVISMTPENDLNNYTDITWSNENSYDSDGDIIIVSEWKLNGVIQQEMPKNLEVGKHTVELRVQDEQGSWSEPNVKIVSVEKKNNKPIAIISMTPENDLKSDTEITWDYSQSTDIDGDDISEYIWKLNGVVQQEMPKILESGTHTVELIVKDEHGLWSEPVLKIVSVEKKEILKEQIIALDHEFLVGSISTDEWEIIDLNNVEGYLGQNIKTLTRVDNVIVAGLSSNGFLRSEDNGRTWTHIEDSSTHVNNGLASNGSTILATKWNNYYLKSTNYGKTWQPITNLPNATAQFDIANNGSNFVLVGNQYIFYSPNNGSTWDSFDYFTAFRAVSNHNSNFVVVGQSHNTTKEQEIYISKNNGQAWTKVYSKKGIGTFVSVEIYNNTIIAVQGTGDIIYSNDLGSTWKVKQLSTNGFSKIKYDSSLNAFVLIGSKTVMYSTDLGSTWKETSYFKTFSKNINDFVSLN